MNSCGKPAQKQGKVISQKTIDLVLSMYEDDEFSSQMPGEKDPVSTAKGVINRNLLFYATLELPSRKKILMLSLVFQILHISTKMVCTCWVFRYSFCMCIFFNWDSLPARLNSHCQVGSYKKRITKKINGYRKSV